MPIICLLDSNLANFLPLPFHIINIWLTFHIINFPPVIRELKYRTVHCHAPHCVALHCNALHCNALFGTELHCTVFQSNDLYCIVLHCTAFNCTEQTKPKLNIIILKICYMWNYSSSIYSTFANHPTSHILKEYAPWWRNVTHNLYCYIFFCASLRTCQEIQCLLYAITIFIVLWLKGHKYIQVIFVKHAFSRINFFCKKKK